MNERSANRLLAALSTADDALISPLLEPVALKQNEVLFETGQPIEHVHFFEGGLSSEIAMNPHDKRIEVGCVGREGLSGLPVLLGVDETPHRSFMQVGGPALRIGSRDLQQAMDMSASLRALLLRYVHVFMIQVAATALSDGRNTIEQRVARWLLMSHDRIGSDELPLTHEAEAGIARALPQILQNLQRHPRVHHERS